MKTECYTMLECVHESYLEFYHLDGSLIYNRINMHTL